MELVVINFSAKPPDRVQISTAINKATTTGTQFINNQEMQKAINEPIAKATNGDDIKCFSFKRLSLISFYIKIVDSNSLTANFIYSIFIFSYL